jgi:hypothetical protein
MLATEFRHPENHLDPQANALLQHVNTDVHTHGITYDDGLRAKVVVAWLGVSRFMAHDNLDIHTCVLRCHDALMIALVMSRQELTVLVHNL